MGESRREPVFGLKKKDNPISKIHRKSKFKAEKVFGRGIEMTCFDTS